MPLVTNIPRAVAFWLLWVAAPCFGEFSNQDKTILLTATVQESPAQIQLNWTAPTSAAYVITHQKLYRRQAGQPWGAEYTSLANSDLTFIDASVEIGQLYEYRIVRLFSNGPLSSTGYLEAGIRLPEIDHRGSVLLLVKDTAAVSMPTELTRLQEDLAGDGWQVIREDVSTSQSVEDVKNVIRGHYQNPAISDLRSVFLFGRIPVPYSGLINPDGHTDHLGAWPADVFYAEMNGTWTDSEVDDIEARGTRNDNVPGDGKYDQSVLPSAVELEIGRVDLSNMTVFPDASTSENDLLLRYLNRDHSYRHRLGDYASVPRRGLIDDYIHWGYRGNDTFVSNAWWNFTSFFGSENIDEGDWFTTLDTNCYLWSFAEGPGKNTYTEMSGVGTSIQFGTTDSKAVFSMMLGSYLGDWDTPNNFLRAPLAGTVNGLGLANMWAGRPHWHIHSMAMGETLGHGTKRTQNNIGEYPAGAGGGWVHVALMGDPTLRLFPVLSPSGLGHVSSAGKVTLNWTASIESSIEGYAIYRGASDARATGLFSRVNGALVTGTSFEDRSGVPGTTYTYMVRAVKLETSASGTYLNSSQGVFVDATADAVAGPEISMTGNSRPIPDGSTQAQLGNHTMFDRGEINLDSMSRVFTIRNDGSSTLTLSGSSVVTLSGVGAGDFQVVAQPRVVSLNPGEETTFMIRFSPSVVGMRGAVASLASDDADEAEFDFHIAGEGMPNTPDIAVATTSFTKILNPGVSGSSALTFQNNGLGHLNYTLASDYDFRDSSAADGPAYQWINIAGIGAEIAEWTGTSYATDNGGSPSISMGFNFPFYGNSYSSLIVSTEGFVTFGNWVDAALNAPVLPNLGAPGNMLALYWDDLDLRGTEGKVYSLQLDPDTFIIQYEGVYQYSSDPKPSDERLTCQAIFKSSGEVILQYKSVPTTEHYLVGMQNGELNQGLTIAVNSSQIVNNMAVRILPPAEKSWLSISPDSGVVSPLSSGEVALSFNPSSLPFGDYFGRLWLKSNDADTPLIEIDLLLQGGVHVPEVAVEGNHRVIPYQSTSASISNHTHMGEFDSGAATQIRNYTVLNLGTENLNLGDVSVTGSDFTLVPPLSDTLAPGASATFQLSFASGKPVGDYSTTVTVPSDDANEPMFTFVVKAKNLSLLEKWRLGYFSSSANTGLEANDADPDFDGMVNLMEYALGGNPLVHDALEILPSIVRNGDGRTEFYFQRDSAKTDITYAVQASETMGDGSWVSIASSVAGADTIATGAFAVDDSGSSPVNVTVTDSEVNPGRRFFRLLVTVP